MMRRVLTPLKTTLSASTNASIGRNQFAKVQVRNLNVHEHNAFSIMEKYGVSLPKGVVARTAEEAEKAFNDPIFGSSENKDIVIKAQALTGGRGRGHFDNGFQGGVHIVRSAAEAKEIAGSMLGNKLITKQTGEEGKPVNQVFMMERLYLRREAYFSILMDRGHAGPILVGSPSGGMAIEDVAAATPEKIFTERIDINKGVDDETASRLASNMGFLGSANAKCADTIKKLYDLFIKSDATLVEINPLAETPDSGVYACDCKLNFDDNAQFRQKEIHELRDRSQEDSREVEAAEYDLNYIGLDGSIGCLVNGAGLAMATMDIIKLNGGSPANFLDVGGGANEQQVQKAFEILNADQKVKAILVNIFGGIMRCDVIAQGVVAAAKTIGLKKPLIIRLQGTNVDKAKEIVNNSGVKMIMTDDLDDAAAKAVRIAEIVTAAEEVDVGVSFEIPN